MINIKVELYLPSLFVVAIKKEIEDQNFNLNDTIQIFTLVLKLFKRQESKNLNVSRKNLIFDLASLSIWKRRKVMEDQRFNFHVKKISRLRAA